MPGHPTPSACGPDAAPPRQVGFELKKGSHPIVPIMLYDAALASEMAQKLLQRGIFVVGFSYPVRARPRASPARLGGHSCALWWWWWCARWRAVLRRVPCIPAAPVCLCMGLPAQVAENLCTPARTAAASSEAAGMGSACAFAGRQAWRARAAGGAQGPGAHPGAAVGGAHGGAPADCGRRVHRSWARAGRHQRRVTIGVGQGFVHARVWVAAFAETFVVVSQAMRQAWQAWGGAEAQPGRLLVFLLFPAGSCSSLLLVLLCYAVCICNISYQCCALVRVSTSKSDSAEIIGAAV